MTVDQILELVKVIGVPGVVAVAAVYALKLLHGQLSLVQDRRIEDARATTKQLLELVENEHKQREMLAKAMDSIADAVREQRLQIEALHADRGVNQRPPLITPRSR